MYKSGSGSTSPPPDSTMQSRRESLTAPNFLSCCSGLPDVDVSVEILERNFLSTTVDLAFD